MGVRVDTRDTQSVHTESHITPSALSESDQRDKKGWTNMFRAAER